MQSDFLWPNRELALAHLCEKHPSRMNVVRQGFDHIDACLTTFESVRSPLALACGISLVKGKNFAVCALGMITDGYGQECGVLLRLLVEHIELLNYLEKYPDEAERALENRLPRAGVRAQRINGSFKFLRDHLNEHSSHGSFSDHSVGHVLNLDGTFNSRPNFGPTTFDTNFRVTALFTVFLLRSAVACGKVIDPGSFDSHAEGFDKFLQRARHVFEISDAEAS